MVSVQEKIADFFGRYPEKMYSKGEVLIQADTKPASFYITEGIVSQCTYADNGDKLVLNSYRAGAFISLVSILNDVPSSFLFEASGVVKARRAPSSEVRRFLEENPDVTLDALTRLSRGGDGLMMRLAQAMGGNAEERILQELAIIEARYNGHEGDSFTTVSGITSQTGLARETVSRSIKRLREQGLVSQNPKGHITLVKK